MEKLSQFSPVLLLHGQGRTALPYPRPLMAGAGGIDDPVIVRLGKLYWTTASCNNEESKACTSQGSTIEPPISAQEWVSQP